MDLDVRRTITKENPFRVCFVCLGNICRSPTAEGVFKHLAAERGLEPYFEADSSGTSAYHIGESANSKSQQIAQQHGVELHSRARQFKASDFNEFDLILAMDEDNLQNVESLDVQDEYGHNIVKLRAFDPDPGDGNVPDPYYGGVQGFENVFQIIKRSCHNLLDQLEAHIER